MDMKKNHFVGRSDAIDRLHGVLSGRESAGGPLTIQSIEGPGGIGKTFLFNHALSGVDLTKRNYITLRIDGSCLSNNREFTQAVVRLIYNAEANAIRNSNKPARYYFPRVDHVLKVIENIRNEAAEEFKKLNPGNQNGLDAFLLLLDKAFETGKNINDIFPITRKCLNFKYLGKYYQIIKETLPLMKSLNTESKKVFETFGRFSKSRALRNAIKENACLPLADALVSDLSAILIGYRKIDLLRATHRKVDGIDRLLMIIDDYEMLQAPLGEFLVSSFLPALRTVNFQTVVIIMGRDQLVATHTS